MCGHHKLSKMMTSNSVSEDAQKAYNDIAQLPDLSTINWRVSQMPKISIATTQTTFAVTTRTSAIVQSILSPESPKSNGVISEKSTIDRIVKGEELRRKIESKHSLLIKIFSNKVSLLTKKFNWIRLPNLRTVVLSAYLKQRIYLNSRRAININNATALLISKFLARAKNISQLNNIFRWLYGQITESTKQIRSIFLNGWKLVKWHIRSATKRRFIKTLVKKQPKLNSEDEIFSGTCTYMVNLRVVKFFNLKLFVNWKFRKKKLIKKFDKKKSKQKCKNKAISLGQRISQRLSFNLIIHNSVIPSVRLMGNKTSSIIFGNWNAFPYSQFFFTAV